MRTNGKLTRTYTFDNGVVVELRKVPPLLLNELQKNNPPPKPPTQKTEFGEEENPAHPDYISQIEDYNRELGLKLLYLLIKRGVVCEVDTEAVEQLRKDMAEEGIKLPESDLVVYIAQICLTSQEEINQFQNAVMGLSQPTEAAIAEVVDSFPVDVQEAGSVVVPSAALRH